ncbi:hypothetical protein PWT90_07212 [Aphanocladium album]|nr:hypothetical protein PWT90_07212 [Aphanocladium album]
MRTNFTPTQKLCSNLFSKPCRAANKFRLRVSVVASDVQRCEQRGEACEYNRRQWVSKGDLRAEIGRLRHSMEEAGSHQAQDHTSSSTTNDNAVLQGWIDNVRSPELENGQLALPGAVSIAFSSDSLPGGARIEASSTKTTASTSSSSCFDHLLSWRSCHPSFQQRRRDRSSSTVSTVGEVSLPSAPLDAYNASTDIDLWTQTGWTRAHIRHLFDVLVTWDSISFCILRKHEFLQDFESGSSRFCSSALVHALLALATRLINETEDESHVLPSGWLGSKYFLQKAETMLREQGSPRTLPDIQSLGILAFYHIRCGQENAARELAEQCSSGIRSLCSQERDASTLEEQYIKVRATTYCGAISLLRMLHLTTGIIFSRLESIEEDSYVLDQLPCTGTGLNTMVSDLSSETTLNFQLETPQILIVKMFQLTEWVYKAIVANQNASPAITENVLVTYTKCLSWYRDIFHLIGSGSRSPFILFLHMYYHFCLLCAFRPFVGSDLVSLDVQPHEMCAQAVQSILTLAQSYDDLFSLRRVSALIPYFVCASGLFSLAIEDSGAHLEFANMRPRTAISPQEPHPTNVQGTSFFPPETTSPSQIKVSTVVQARLLLAKMGASHPAAAMAEEKLGESLKSWRRSRAVKPN